MSRAGEGEGAGAGLEGGSSADAAGLQPQDQEQEPEPDLGEQLGAIIDDRLRARLDVIERRMQSMTDRQQNQIEGLGQRIEALAGQGATLAELRELVGDLHEVSVDPNEREKRALDHKLARLEQAVQRSANPPPSQQQQAPALAAGDAAANGEVRFYTEIAPDLEDYARLRGFSAEDLASGAWMDRLAAAGAPQQIDYTPAGIRSYKDGVKRALDKLAQDRAAVVRARTRPSTPVTAGGGGNDVLGYQERLKKGGALPTAAEIDRMTQRYLTG